MGGGLCLGVACTCMCVVCFKRLGRLSDSGSFKLVTTMLLALESGTVSFRDWEAMPCWPYPCFPPLPPLGCIAIKWCETQYLAAHLPVYINDVLVAGGGGLTLVGYKRLKAMPCVDLPGSVTLCQS